MSPVAHKALAAVAGFALLLTGAVTGPVQAAKVVNACVKTNSGEVRIVSAKKKCKKGWKKVSWNQKGATGQQGATGTAGANLMVRDRNGALVGKLLGVLSEGISIFFVEVDGGAYTYLPDGTVYSVGGGSPDYLNNTCTGSAYIRMGSSVISQQLITGAANGPSRLVYRKTDPSFGPTFAWKFSTNVQDLVATQLYKRDQKFDCVPDGGPFTGKVGLLESVTAPPDVPGPLTVG